MTRLLVRNYSLSSEFPVLKIMFGLHTAEEDYEAVDGMIVFQPLATRRCITITTSDDSTDEVAEQFFVSLSNPSSSVDVTVGVPSSTTIIILDNDEPTTAPPPSKNEVVLHNVYHVYIIYSKYICSSTVPVT